VTRFILVALCLAGCAGQVEAPQESVCLSHPAIEFIVDQMACEEGSPSCGFTADNQPIAITEGAPVDFVCHCIGGHYGCFGHQP
jgi:hypothetical protein